MQPIDVIAEARNDLLAVCDEIIAETEPAWQNECIRQLQQVTGLSLELTSDRPHRLPKSENRSELSCPSSRLWTEADLLAKTEPNLDSATQKLVSFYLGNLPAECRNQGVFDVLIEYYLWIPEPCVGSTTISQRLVEIYQPTKVREAGEPS